MGTTTFTDSSASSGQIYDYRLTAKDPLASSDLSSAYNVIFCDSNVPDAPLGVQADGGDSQVTLTWNASSTAGPNAVVGYYVYRDQMPADNCPFAPEPGFGCLNTVPIAERSFVDLTVTNGTSYSYLIKARDTAGLYSPPSSQVVATPIDRVAPAAPRNLRAHTGCVTATVSLSWELNSEPDIQGYYLYRGNPSTILERLPLSIPGSPSFPVEDGSGTDPIYAYAVSAYDTSGNESPLSSVLQAQERNSGVAAPTNLTVEAGHGRVTLNWSASPEQNKFTIYRRLLGSGCSDFQPVFSGTLSPQSPDTTDFSFTDNSVSNAKVYQYVVSAFDSTGLNESLDSPVGPEAVPLQQPGGPVVCEIPISATSYPGLGYAWAPQAFHSQYDPTEAALAGQGYIGFAGFTTNINASSSNGSTTWNRTGFWDNKTFFYPVPGFGQWIQVRAVYKVNDWKFCDEQIEVFKNVCRAVGGSHRVLPPELYSFNPAFHPATFFSEPLWLYAPGLPYPYYIPYPAFKDTEGNALYPRCEDRWPDRPNNVQASATGVAGEIRVQWDAPPDTSQVISYRIYVDRKPVVEVPTTPTDHVLRDMSTCRRALISVESVDALGIDSQPWLLDSIVAPRPAGSPLPPAFISNRPGPDVGQIALGWSGSLDYGCYMTGVEITRTKEGVVEDTRTAPHDYFSPRFRIDGAAEGTLPALEPNALYGYSLKAIYTLSELNGTVPLQIMSSPAVAMPSSVYPMGGGDSGLPMPTGVVVQEGATPGSVTVNWATQEDLGYRLQYWSALDNQAQIWNPATLLDSTMLPVTVTGLTPGRVYFFAVESARQTGTDSYGAPLFDESPWSPATSFLVPADESFQLFPPTGLTATPGPGEAQISLTWTAPSPAPQGYHLYHVSYDTETILPVSEPADLLAHTLIAGTSVVLSNLPMGVQLTFVVRSVDDTGNESINSEPIRAYAYDALPADPRPYCAYCSVDVQREIHFVWYARTDTQTVNYTVIRRGDFTCPAEDQQQKEFPTIPASLHSIVDSDIAPNCRYTYAVWARDPQRNYSLHAATAVVVNNGTCYDSCIPPDSGIGGGLTGNPCTLNCEPGPVTHPVMVLDRGQEETGEGCRVALTEERLDNAMRQIDWQELNMEPYRSIGLIKPINNGGGGGSDYVPPSFQWRIFHTDYLGTPRIITDASGNIVSEHHYLPFGEEVPPSDHNGVGNLSNNSHRFTGHERDAETGLDYMLARYYSSSLGRFLAVDPKPSFKRNLSTPQGWNRYAYVRNNPLALIDPDGQTDIYVFRPTATNSGSAWSAIQAEAPKYGNTVTIHNGSSATTQNYTQALSQSGAAVVFSGHTVHDSTGTVGSVQLSNGDVGTMQGSTSTSAPTATPAVQASTVGLFGCDTTDLAGQYTPATATMVDGGANGATTLNALDAAAAGYTDALARDQDAGAATTQADGAIQRSHDPQDKDGDKATVRKSEKK